EVPGDAAGEAPDHVAADREVGAGWMTWAGRVKRCAFLPSRLDAQRREGHHEQARHFRRIGPQASWIGNVADDRMHAEARAALPARQAAEHRDPFIEAQLLAALAQRAGERPFVALARAAREGDL